jgi:hypothetical protein
MFDFLRPGTKVWTGENLDIQAVITKVSIVRDMTVFYTIEYWEDRQAIVRDIERFQFSLENTAEDITT